ncbi:MAG: M55 family metallopeptidase [Planctomycetota bacterium]
MKLYLLVDMEGISGISRIEQVKRHMDGGRAYQQGCRLLAAEINHAVDVCLDAGATSILVCDTHAAGGNLDPNLAHPAAEYETPAPDNPMPGLDPSFDGVFLLGHHGMAGSDGFLEHTYSSAIVFSVTLGGRPIGEIGIEAAWAGGLGVPVLGVTGDQAAADEARNWLGDDLPVASVKQAVCRDRARCLGMDAAYKQIERVIREGVAQRDREPWTPDLPAEVRWVYCRADQGPTSSRDGWTRTDPRTACRLAERPDQLRPI